MATLTATTALSVGTPDAVLGMLLSSALSSDQSDPLPLQQDAFASSVSPFSARRRFLAFFQLFGDLQDGKLVVW